ncbi:Probable phage ClpP protease [Campylobacter phage CP220]|uniref:Probable phage ClpP protease n=1 Tax=Campylobacter phage CP220 TaxID=2994044 RepID=D5GVE4_9CAUD|nr:head maturation protease [Campylobacter phage CP220]CBJ93961.1 Probable phage ClpP protease [Campylobacter phage CP220]
MRYEAMNNKTKMEDSELDIISVKDARHSLYKKSFNYTNYTLNINSFDHEEGELENIFASLNDAAEGDSIQIFIASVGGFADELNRFTNIIRTKFYGNVTTVLNPFGYSCGAMLFLIGNSRVIYENSSIMFHSVSFGVSGKHSDVKTQFDFSNKYWNEYMKSLLNPYLTKKEIELLIDGVEFWFDAYEMCKRGIATHINVFGLSMKASDYCEYIDNLDYRIAFLEYIIKEGDLDSIDLQRAEIELEQAKKDAKKAKTIKTIKTTKKAVESKPKAKTTKTAKAKTTTNSEIESNDLN